MRKLILAIVLAGCAGAPSSISLPPQQTECIVACGCVSYQLICVEDFPHDRSTDTCQDVCACNEDGSIGCVE